MEVYGLSKNPTSIEEDTTRAQWQGEAIP